MPGIRVDHCRRDFVDDVAHVRALVAEARGYRRLVATGTYEYVGRRRVEELTALALLRAQLGWESLVEDSFVRYMCGAQSASGFSPTLLNPPERTIGNATATVFAGRRFASWSIRNTVARANQQFDRGEPYTSAIAAARMVLEDMAAVRNRIAHASAYAASEFTNVVRGRLGYVPRGMTPGRFLLTDFRYPRAAGGMTFIDLYLNVLLGAAAVLIP